MPNRRWTPEKVDILKARYATCDNKDLVALLGFDQGAIRNKACTLGLVKKRATLATLRGRADSFQGRVRQLLMAAAERGLRAVSVAELMKVDTEAALKTLQNLTYHGNAWRVRGRKGETRWFGTPAFAEAFEAARAAAAAPRPYSAWPAPPRSIAPPPPKPAPAPLNVTERTRHVVAPPPPERFGGAPVDCSFSNLRPGEYLPLAPSRWVAAITGSR